MADYPADIGGRPVNIAGIDVIDIGHAPLQRNNTATGIAHHALGLPGGAGGIKNIQRMVGCHRHTFSRLGLCFCLVPVNIPPRHQLGCQLGSLHNDTGLRFVVRQLYRFIQQRLIGDYARRLDTTRGSHDNFRCSIINAHRQFIAGKAAKYHRMNSPDAGAGQHGNHRLWHHRHVYNDPISASHTALCQRPGKAGYPVQQFGVGNLLFTGGNRAVVADRHLLTTALLYLQIQRVETGIGHAIRVPAIKGRIAGIEHPSGSLIPENLLSGLFP